MKTMPGKFTRLFSFLSLFCLSQVANAQAYSIQLNLPRHTNDTVLFAHHFNGKLFVNDTIITDSSGMAKIEGREILPQGIYQLYFDPKKQIDFLIGADQSMSIQENNDQLKISGAIESEQFQAYLNFLNEKKKQAEWLREQLNRQSEPSDSIPILKEQLSKLDQEVQQHWKEEAQKATGTFYGKFVASNIRTVLSDDQIPAAMQANDSLMWAYRYHFNKDHYWDHFDIYDIRMWRTPTIQSRLNEYFNKVLVQHADSVLPVAIRMIESSRDQPEIFQNLVSFVLNNSVKSPYAIIENVFVAIAEKYYLGEKAFWASEETIENIRREVYFRKNNLIGETARELLLEDEFGEYQSLHQQSTPYTILVFWEPECGHCKTQIPQLFEEVFLESDPSHLAVMAVYTQDNKEEWLDFIQEHELNGWMNVWDPNRVSNFQVNYNVRTTPAIYLLDRDKKILTKRLNVESTKKILKELITPN